MSEGVEASPSPEAADPAGAAGATSRVCIPVICRLRDLSELRERLLACLPTAESVAIDAGDVESIDTATLQLLCAFERDRTRMGRSTAYSRASAAFRKAAATLGLDMTLPAAS